MDQEYCDCSPSPFPSLLLATHALQMRIKQLLVTILLQTRVKKKP